MSITAEKIIKLDEGWRNRQYYCSEGYVTIGWGRKVSNQKHAPLTNEIADKEKETIFVREQVRSISYQLMTRFSVAWNNCNQNQQAVLIAMCYQMGIAGVSAFKKMFMAIERKDFEMASREMLNSKWAKQTANRANRYAEIMHTGSLSRYYLTNGEIP